MTESYRLFDDWLSTVRLGPGLIEGVRMLSDQGRGLLVYCKGYEFRRYFCFRHLLELPGSDTDAALVARRLFFTSLEREYVELKEMPIIDFRVGCEEAEINAGGAQHFCESSR
jgi:hypothetical protein